MELCSVIKSQRPAELLSCHRCCQRGCPCQGEFLIVGIIFSLRRHVILRFLANTVYFQNRYTGVHEKRTLKVDNRSLKWPSSIFVGSSCDDSIVRRRLFGDCQIFRLITFLNGTIHKSPVLQRLVSVLDGVKAGEERCLVISKDTQINNHINLELSTRPFH